MQKGSLSKNRTSTLEISNTQLHSTNLDTMTNRSPSDYLNPRSVKNSDYGQNKNFAFSKGGKKLVNNSFSISPDLATFKAPNLRNNNRYNNISLSPRRLKLSKPKDDPRHLLGLNASDTKRSRFNVKDVVYSDVGHSSRKPAKSVMDILRETNDAKILQQEMTLFDNFKFPKDMRVTSNVLEMHPQIVKDKLRISKFIHKYFNPALYERNNMRAIKAIMKLDNSMENGHEGSANLFKPYQKEATGLQALREHKKLK